MHYFFANMDSWKADRPTSNPSWLKAQSRQVFIASWLLLHGNMGPTFARCRNKWPWRPLTKKSNQNFIVTGMSCLYRGRTANLGNRKFTAKDHSSQSLMRNSYFERWRCSSWIVDPNSIFHPYRLSDLFMSWMSLQNKESGNEFLKQTCPTNLFLAMHYFFANIGSWKAGRPKNLAETSLWQAWVASDTQEHQATGREWRFRLLCLNKHVKQISWHLQ